MKPLQILYQILNIAKRVMKSWQPWWPEAWSLWELDIIQIWCCQRLMFAWRVRFARPAMPIIVLSKQKIREFDKVIGLEIGADDYDQNPSNRIASTCEGLTCRSSLRLILSLKMSRYHILPWFKRPTKNWTWPIVSLNCFITLQTHVGQVMTREHLLEAVWARLLWWCTGSGMRFVENEDTSPYLDPPWCRILYEKWLV